MGGCSGTVSSGCDEDREEGGTVVWPWMEREEARGRRGEGDVGELVIVGDVGRSAGHYW